MIRRRHPKPAGEWVELDLSERPAPARLPLLDRVFPPEQCCEVAELAGWKR